MESLTGRIGANTRAKPQLPSDKTPNSSVEQVTVVEPRFRTSNALAARRPSKNRSARWKSRLGLKWLSISPRGSPDRKVFDKRPWPPSALASKTLRVHETAAATSYKYSVLTPFAWIAGSAVNSEPSEARWSERRDHAPPVQPAPVLSRMELG